MISHHYFLSALVFLCVISKSLLKELPGYIQVCKRDPATIDSCIANSIEALKPKLLSGIPEIGVPKIDPLFIPEIKLVTSGNVRAVGQKVYVTGAGDFKIKKLTVDLDALTIKARVLFPKLHFEGDYEVDAQVLVLPLKGKGKFNADAVKCDADVMLQVQIFTHDGADYIKFTKIDSDINIKDYRIKLDGLFNGDKALGDAANAAINQNRGDFLKALKPRIEKTVNKMFLDTANKIVDGLTFDQLLPKP